MKKRQSGLNLIRHEGWAIAQLYDTKIVVYDTRSGDVIIDTGGFWTRSTLKAINTALADFLLPFRIRGRLTDCELILEPYETRLGEPKIYGQSGPWFKIKSGSGQIYRVRGVDDIGKGFQWIENENERNEFHLNNGESLHN